MDTHTGEGRCLRCGGTVGSLLHVMCCDGQQGAVEAAEPSNVVTFAVPRFLGDVDPAHNVRATDPETSYLAAFRHPFKRTNLRWRCYAALRAVGGSGYTDDELHLTTGIALNSANKRRGELTQAGLVIDSGGRRLTRAGSPAIVWVAV